MRRKSFGSAVSAARNKGFTLIEVMVAMAVVAVALPALLTLIMSQLDGTVIVREKTFAFWVAENEMTRMRLQQQLIPNTRVPDSDSGTVKLAEQDWFWEISTEATDYEGFRRVEIVVARQANRDAPVASLLGFIDE